MKICFSYSIDENYSNFLNNSLKSLLKNAPNLHAYVDLINFKTQDNNFPQNEKITYNYLNVDVPSDKITIKNKGCSVLKERTVNLTGAYANLRKVYNIYNLLNSGKYDVVVNMDADNLILRDVEEYIKKLPQGYDIHIKYIVGELSETDIERRKNNFRHFDISQIEFEPFFHEGCTVIKNTENSRKFFKIVSENLLNKLVWYGDSYWISYAYKKLKDTIKIDCLPFDFVIYDLDENTIKTAYVCSGYGYNKYKSLYKQLASTVSE